MIRALLFLVAIVCAASGCSMSADTAAAEQGVTKFHSMLDAGQFDQIYDESSSVMKNASTKEKLVAILDAVHHKLGNVKSSSQTGFSVNYLNGSTHIVLTCKTIFDHPSSTLSVRNRIDFVALTEQRRGFRGQKNRKPCGGTPYSLSKHLTASFV